MYHNLVMQVLFWIAESMQSNLSPDDLQKKTKVSIYTDSATFILPTLGLTTQETE